MRIVNWDQEHQKWHTKKKSNEIIFAWLLKVNLIPKCVQIHSKYLNINQTMGEQSKPKAKKKKKMRWSKSLFANENEKDVLLCWLLNSSLNGIGKYGNT